MLGTWLPAVVGGIVAALSTPPLLLFLKRHKVLDIASSRSSHTGTAVRGVGLATLAGVTVGLLVAYYHVEPGDGGLLLVILVTSFCAAILGATEDFRGLSVGARATVQLLMAVVASVAILLETGAPWFFGVPAAVFIAGYINAANFVDGLDGMSGIHGLVCGLFYLYIGFHIDASWLLTTGGVIAACFGVFLPWNLGRKGTFLGDSGSYLLGALVSIVAVSTWLSGVPLLVAFAPTIIYGLDAGGTLVRRIAKGEKWYEAHRDFVYQRISIAGLPHLGASLVVGVFSTSVSALIFWTSHVPWLSPIVGCMGVILLCVLYWFTPSMVLRLRQGYLQDRQKILSSRRK